jgi:hypothetical protein
VLRKTETEPALLAFLLTNTETAADVTVGLRLPLGMLGASIRGRARRYLSSVHRASA